VTTLKAIAAAEGAAAAGRAVGASSLRFVTETARLWALLWSALRTLVSGPWLGQPLRLRAVAQQVVRAGNQSLPLVLLIAVLVGMILALQSAYQLRRLAAEDLTAALVAVSVTRELAPLLTAILVAGRVGSAIAAELGTMSVSQEIDALVVMGIQPIHFLVVPRLLGLLIALPCLTVLADLAGILGGCGVAVATLGTSTRSYLLESMEALELRDLWGGVVKSAVFAAIIGLVGCQQGLQTRGGADEVGRATTTSVVRSIVLMIGADLFVTALLYSGL
jgi:phospholipid/cholesterol/gamma-HCH transport system permease protein